MVWTHLQPIYGLSGNRVLAYLLILFGPFTAHILIILPSCLGPFADNVSWNGFRCKFVSWNRKSSWTDWEDQILARSPPRTAGSQSVGPHSTAVREMGSDISCTNFTAHMWTILQSCWCPFNDIVWVHRQSCLGPFYDMVWVQSAPLFGLFIPICSPYITWLTVMFRPTSWYGLHLFTALIWTVLKSNLGPFKALVCVIIYSHWQPSLGYLEAYSESVIGWFSRLIASLHLAAYEAHLQLPFGLVLV